jgi:hypothetical protein
MSDFVNRLLGEGDAPPIRPIVPSLFERASRAEEPLPMGAVTDLHPQRTIAPEPRQVVVELPAPAAQPMACPAHAEAPVAAPSVAEAAEPVHQVVPAAPAAEKGHPPVSQVRLPEAGTFELHRDRAPDAVVERGEVTSQRPPAAPAAHPVAALPPVAAVPVAAAPPRAHPVGSLTRQTVPEHPVSTSIPVGARRAPSAEPTVHISIGRVEVKASAQAAAPKPAQRANQPVLSLDDYLRDRAGGDRR